MKSTTKVCGILLLAGAVSGAQVASHAPTVFKSAPAAQNKTVAVVNGTTLTTADLTREEYAIFPYARQHNGIPKPLEAEIRDGAMKMMVFEELVYQEALRRKVTIPAVRMQSAETDFRKQFGSPDAYEAFLQSDFQGSEKLLREKIRRSLLIDALLKEEIESKCTVSLAEAHAYYQRNPAGFEHPESYTFQTISVLPPANATAAQLQEGRTRAEKALPQAKATKTAEQFGLLAEKISDDDYRVVMGQHKPVPVSELAPPVLQQLKSMQVGEVSGLIQLDQAYTIVRLNEHTPAGRTPFAEVKARLMQQLQQTKRNQLRAALDARLRQNAKIEQF